MSDGPILITGAGGFVCSEIAVALRDAGHRVVALDQQFDGPTRARLAGIRLVEGKLETSMADADLGAPSAVIHGAAITASPDRLGLTRAEHIRRNVEMLTATLAFARNTGAARLLFLSSMGVFNADDAPAPDGRFTEATIPSATCAYCVAKQVGEILTKAAAEPDFATLSLRLGNIIGPHEAVRETRQVLCLISRMMAEARSDGVIHVRTPEAEREWSWLPDLAGGIVSLLPTIRPNAPRVLHAGSPPIITDLALARAVAERIPGTTLRLAPPPHSPIRPPMASDHASAMGAINWTRPEAILDALIPVEVTS